MADIKKKLELLVDVDNPVEEIKDCVIAISIMHPSNQLEILKQVEIWIGETIEAAESKLKVSEEQTTNEIEGEDQARKE